MGQLKMLLPQFGMGMKEAEVIKWLKAPGDEVKAGDLVVEIEAAKTTVEVPAPSDGVLTEIIAKVGDIVEVRSHLATFTV